MVIVLAGMVLASQASAQNRFGLFGGINIANQGSGMEEVGNQIDSEFESQFGGTWNSKKSSSTGVGVGVSFLIQTSETVGLQLEAQYIQRGSKIQTSGQDISMAGLPSSLDVTSKFKLKYFEFPFMARYSPNPKAKVRPVFLGGLVIGFKTGADLEVETGGTSSSQDISEGYEDYTAGALFGVGMDVKTGRTAHLLVQARYYLGLTDPLAGTAVEAKSGDLGFFVGFEFDLQPTASEAQ